VVQIIVSANIKKKNWRDLDVRIAQLIIVGPNYSSDRDKIWKLILKKRFRNGE
jgi:hypothetical protein